MEKHIFYLVLLFFMPTLLLAQRQIDLEVQLISPDDQYVPNAPTGSLFEYYFSYLLINHGEEDITAEDTLRYYFYRDGVLMGFLNENDEIVDYNSMTNISIPAGESVVVNYLINEIASNATNDWLEYCSEFYVNNIENEIIETDSTNNTLCKDVLYGTELPDLGLADYNMNKNHFFPNPAVDFIEFKEVPANNIRLISLEGKITDMKIEGKRLPIGHLNKGMYIVEYEYQGKYIKQKLIVE